MPATLHMVPEGRNTAASWPSRSATRSHNRLTVGSSPICSSPTSARAIASRIAGVGRVCVSDSRLMGTGAALGWGGARWECMGGLGTLSVDFGKLDIERAAGCVPKSHDDNFVRSHAIIDQVRKGI